MGYTDSRNKKTAGRLFFKPKVDNMNKAISFIKESYEELRKVSWPSRKQTINYTLVVVGVSVAVAVFLGVLDMMFSSIVEKIIF